jgi:hypothetical protein
MASHADTKLACAARHVHTIQTDQSTTQQAAQPPINKYDIMHNSIDAIYKLVTKAHTVPSAATAAGTTAAAAQAAAVIK